MAEPVRFPNIPLYEGWGAPNRVESDITGLELISGELPKDLRGCLFRCGPDRQFPSMFKDDIFIDGEGMVVMFRFENGHVDFKSRYGEARRDPGKQGRVRRGVGIGVATWGGGGHASKCKLTIHPDGSVEVELGSQDIGTGTRTCITMVAAESLGLPKIGRAHV